MADKVLLICKRTVVSIKPVQVGNLYSPSVLDQIMRRNNLRVIFYYQTSYNSRRQLGEMTKKLRESISKFLCAFPIVTGRLVMSPEGHWMIKCNDAGVRMLEARAKGSIDEWLKNVDREKELNLVYWEPMFHKPYFWSTFYVQITEFEEGGLAIGLSCTQLLSDPICAITFIKAWADINLYGKMISPPLFHSFPCPRSQKSKESHNLNTHLIHHYKFIIEKPSRTLDTNQTTISLAFGDEMVKRCIALCANQNASCQLMLTPFEALTAMLWTCISKIKGMRNGLVNMSICLDMRNVLGLDKGYFGNCMIHNNVNTNGLEASEGFSKAARAIREAIEKMDYEGVMNLVGWLKGNSSNLKSPPWMNGYDLIFANLEDVDPYSAIFEDYLKPINVSCYIEPCLGEGQVLILPSPPSEDTIGLGRVAMISLPRKETSILLQDEIIQQISPTILMH